jgi:phytoene desaturase
MNQKSVGIIGSGLGGLSAAIHLAGKGYKVTVFEKNSTVGGKANNLYKDNFRFDTGPSLLTMPFILEEIFNAQNERIEEYLTIEKLNTICKYFYPDGTTLNAYSAISKFADEIQAKTSDNSESVIGYLNYCKTIYDLTANLFLFKPELNLKSFFNQNAFKSVLNLKKIDPFRTMHQANKSFFGDTKTIQLFDRYATYNGSNPYMAPATLNIIPHVEYTLGSYIAKEGIFAIPLSLKKLAEKLGVCFLTNQKVEAILLKNKTATGVRSNNNDFFFDSIISNVDPNYTYKSLLKTDNSKILKKADPSLSGIVFYWGIKGEYPELEIHNILFSENYRQEFDDIFIKAKCPDDPTIYIYISSKYKTDDAPSGFENWFVMINTPYNNNQDWDTEIRTLRKVVQQKIHKTLGINVSEKIIFEEILSPPDIEKKMGNFGGSIYGISSNTRSAAFIRSPIKSSRYSNLYFCGGSVHPGGGIPLVLLSGKHAAELISRDNS